MEEVMMDEGFYDVDTKELEDWAYDYEWDDGYWDLAWNKKFDEESGLLPPGGAAVCILCMAEPWNGRAAHKKSPCTPFAMKRIQFTSIDHDFVSQT